MRESTNVYSQLYPSWLDNQIPADNDFRDIIEFYVLQSMCDGQSFKGNSLQDTFHWKKNPWNPDSYLKNKIIKTIWGESIPQIYMAEKRSDFQSKIFGKQLDEDFYKNFMDQRAGFVKCNKGKGNENLIMSLFYHLRNGFAHGRFVTIPCAEDDYAIVLEDGNCKDPLFEVTARIVIRKTSLIMVKRLICGGPTEVMDYSQDIIKLICSGINTKGGIIKETGMLEAEWDKEIQRLRLNGIARFDNNHWSICKQ